MKYIRDVLASFVHARKGQLVKIKTEDSSLPDIGRVEKIEINDLVEGYKITIKPSEYNYFVEIPLHIVESLEILPDIEMEPDQMNLPFDDNQLLLPI